MLQINADDVLLEVTVRVIVTECDIFVQVDLQGETTKLVKSKSLSDGQDVPQKNSFKTNCVTTKRLFVHLSSTEPNWNYIKKNVKKKNNLKKISLKT